MTIETKFNRGDKIFFLSPGNPKVISSTVQGFKIELHSISKNPTITYLCNGERESNVNVKVEEERAFKTKEELLKSL